MSKNYEVAHDGLVRFQQPPPIIMKSLKSFGNTKKQGDSGLGMAIGYFASNGITVCVPLTDSQDYDLVVEQNGRLQRIQVRTTYARKPSGQFGVNLRVFGGNRSGTGKVKHFDSAKVDLLFVVTDEGKKYLIPSSEILVRNQLTLNSNMQKYIVE